MKRTIFLSVFLFLLQQAFSQPPAFSVKKGGHCYTMDIPDYLTKTYSLNDVASLQYQNSARSAYVVVIEDDKDQLQEVGMKFINALDFLENFTREFKKDMTGRKVTPAQEFKNNGYGHAQSELYWTEEGSEFYMLITGVETPGYFYKILCWTPLENKGKAQADFQRISRSLKE